MALYWRRAESCAIDLVPVVEQRRDGSATAYELPRRGFCLGVRCAPPQEVGRGTVEHRAARRPARAKGPRRPRVVRRAGPGLLGPGHGTRRKLLAAGLAALILIVGAAGSGLAQQRYQVQPGDSIASVASTFGVDPAAILAASWVPDPDNLTTDDVLIIPDPGQTPSEAAEDAAAHEGSSPWVAGAYDVKAGDTIEDIAAKFGLSPEALASFNGLDDPNLLEIGQRLLIPASGDNGNDGSDGGPVRASVLVERGGSEVPGVPTHKQEHNLSCEYAAAQIATAAFGNAVPEQAFIDNIPVSLNPHDGYRGNIDGWWGNTTDYGVYPEAMTGVLHAWGFGADIFYSQGDATPLKREIDAGNPVLVWIGEWGDTAEALHDDGTYTVAAGDHVVVVYGYDDGGVYFSDPAKADYAYWDWGSFTSMWTVLDGMSMAIYPV